MCSGCTPICKSGVVEKSFEKSYTREQRIHSCTNWNGAFSIQRIYILDTCKEDFPVPPLPKALERFSILWWRLWLRLQFSHCIYQNKGQNMRLSNLQLKLAQNQLFQSWTDSNHFEYHFRPFWQVTNAMKKITLDFELSFGSILLAFLSCLGQFHSHLIFARFLLAVLLYYYDKWDATVITIVVM